MSELSTALGSAGPKHRLTANGKTYPVGLITQAVKVAYEKELYHRARRALADVRAITDKDHYERRLDTLIDRYDAGYYAMESDHGRAVFGTPTGTLLMVSLLLGATAANGDITPLPETEAMNVLMAAPEEAASLLKLVIKESFPDLPPEPDAAPGDTAGPKADPPAGEPGSG